MLRKIILYLATINLTHSTDVGFVKDFYTYYDLHNINYFMCSLNESVKVLDSIRQFGNIFVRFPSLRDAIRNDETELAGNFVDLNCKSGVEILEQLNSRSSILPNLLVWSTTKDQALKTMNTVNFSHYDVHLAVPDIKIYHLFKIFGSEPVVNLRGRWSNTTGYEDLNPSLNNDFKGAVVTAAVKFDDLTPESNLESQMLNRSIPAISDSSNRYSMLLLKYLSEMYNFKLNISVLKEVGQYNNNSVGWDSSILNSLAENTIDLSVTPMEYDAALMDYVQWSPPIKDIRQCFIFRHPHILTEYTGLVVPFTPSVWFITTVLIILCIICLNIATIYLNKSESKPVPPLQMNLSDEIITLVAVMTMQGIEPETTTSYSKRLMYFFSLFLSMMIFAFYGSAIVLFLLSPIPKSITTIDQLMWEFELAAEDIPLNKYHLKNTSHHPVARFVYHTSIESPSKNKDKDRFYHVNYGVENMKSSQFAFFSQNSNMYRRIQETFNDIEICSLAEILLYPSFPIAIAFRKGLPLREYIFKGFIRMKEVGIYQRENKYWFSPKPVCMGSIDMIQVGMVTLAFAYLLYISGLGASIILLVIELLVYNKESIKFKYKLFKFKLN